MTLDSQFQGFLNSHSLWDTPTDIVPICHLVVPPYPKPPIHIKIPTNEVLGKRIEYFFEHYLHYTNQYLLIAKGLQIYDHKTTIGELDFIIKDTHTNQLLHIELVYKFYLYIPDSEKEELAQWIGPNQKDSLPEKIKKLQKKQLPLLHNNCTKITLERMEINTDTIQQQVCFYANLFMPYAMRNYCPPIINPNCIVGYWISISEFTAQQYAAHLFYIPLKKEWIVAPSLGNRWHTYAHILQEIQLHHERKNAPLLWMKSKRGVYTRLFVVWW